MKKVKKSDTGQEEAITQSGHDVQTAATSCAFRVAQVKYCSRQFWYWVGVEFQFKTETLHSW